MNVKIIFIESVSHLFEKEHLSNDSKTQKTLFNIFKSAQHYKKQIHFLVTDDVFKIWH